MAAFAQNQIGRTTRYYYHGWQVLQEEDGSDAVQRQYVYGTYIDEPWVLDDRSGGQSIADLNDGSGSDRQFYHCNTQYSVHALSDETGALTEGYQYDAYGRQYVYTPGTNGTIDWGGDDVITANGASAVSNEYMYTGRRFNPELEKYYFRMRFYDTLRGRFLGRDPLGYSDGPNVYCSNFPLNYIDPNGLMGLPISEAVPDPMPPRPTPRPIPFPKPPPSSGGMSAGGMAARGGLAGAVGVGVFAGTYYYLSSTGYYQAASDLTVGMVESPASRPTQTYGVTPKKKNCKRRRGNCNSKEYRLYEKCGILRGKRAFLFSFEQSLEYLRKVVGNVPGRSKRYKLKDAVAAEICHGGYHKNVTWRIAGQYEHVGSITCCKCCKDTKKGPVIEGNTANKGPGDYFCRARRGRQYGHGWQTQWSR